jgi:hypothetical protein
VLCVIVFILHFDSKLDFEIYIKAGYIELNLSWPQIEVYLFAELVFNWNLSSEELKSCLKFHYLDFTTFIRNHDAAM